MEPSDLKPFADFMKEHGLLVLFVEKPGFKLNMVKEGAPVPPPAPGAAPAPAAEPSPPRGAVVSAPLVGTFYRSPSPEAKPFVETGQKVSRGDVLCIIEAMKVLNQLKSEHDGTILEIRAENGKPVEFGQPLFVIDTGGG